MYIETLSSAMDLCIADRMTGKPSSRPGRPRDPRVEQAILAAAADLIRQRGFDAVTTSEIAAKAGVGKQTIYRRWPSKFALALSVLEHTAEEAITVDQSVDGFFADVVKSARDNAEVLRAVMAQSQFDPGARQMMRDVLIEPRRRALRAMLAHALPDAQADGAVLACYGALWYRLLLGEPLDDDFAGTLGSIAKCFDC
ncbi:MAG: TetR/AcrR family transcriptional regulator [Erythrobacter sp.]